MQLKVDSLQIIFLYIMSTGKGGNLMKFGENLKNLRRAKKLSQEDLAEKVKVSRQSVSKWETGILLFK